VVLMKHFMIQTVDLDNKLLQIISINFLHIGRNFVSIVFPAVTR